MATCFMAVDVVVWCVDQAEVASKNRNDDAISASAEEGLSEVSVCWDYWHSGDDQWRVPVLS